jgi:class 3 adenylate cyclase
MNDESTMPQTWLEREDGERIPVRGTCSMGRAPTNEVILADDKVSRRHAIIHVQGQSDFWLVDLGTINGTNLNNQRVSQPTRLHDQDQIEIGRFRLTFRQVRPLKVVAPSNPGEEETIADIHTAQCWLVLADIVGSTRLSSRLSADEVSVMTGGWLAECKQIIERSAGSIDKFLGDGFLAYWHDGPEASGNVIRVLGALTQLQAREHPPFRIVLHYGEVCAGGLVPLGKEYLWGSEINFVFRVEKLAGSLGETRVASEAASQRLEAGLRLTDVGCFAVPSFTGEFRFFRW